MNIIKLAREAGLYLDGENTQQPLYVLSPSELERFATLVRNAALEEAAGACVPKDLLSTQILTHGHLAARSWCAAQIRKLKEQT